MMQPSMKTSLVLLLGIFGLLTTESTSSPTPGNNTIHSTDEPGNTTTQLLISVTVHNETPTHPSNESAESGAAGTEVRDEANVTHSGSESTTAELAVTVVATEATTSSSGGGLLHTSAATAAVNTTEIKRPNATQVPATAKPTDGEIRQQTTNASANMTAPLATSAAPIVATIAASSATTVSATQHTSTKMPEVTSMLFPNTSEASSSNTSAVTLSRSSPQALNATTPPTKNITSSGATVIDSTPQEKTTAKTEPLTTSQHDSTTRAPVSTVESTKPSTRHPTDSFSTDTTNSTSPVAILIPRAITTKSPAATSKAPPATDPQPCSTIGLVKHCLIVIAALALVATIFMVSTIVLCTKLSGRKYKMRRRQPATEMMCISSLLPERNYTYTRQRNPVSNGVLVMHTADDSDEDGGDNLTLSSFLPDNDRYV